MARRARVRVEWKLWAVIASMTRWGVLVLRNPKIVEPRFLIGELERSRSILLPGVRVGGLANGRLLKSIRHG